MGKGRSEKMRSARLFPPHFGQSNPGSTAGRLRRWEYGDSRVQSMRRYSQTNSSRRRSTGVVAVDALLDRGSVQSSCVRDCG